MSFLRGNPLSEKNKGKGQPVATPKGMNWGAFEAELERRMKEKRRAMDAPDSRSENRDSTRSPMDHKSLTKVPLLNGELVSPKSKSSKVSARKGTSTRRPPALTEDRNDNVKTPRNENERGSQQGKSLTHHKEGRATSRRSADPAEKTPRESRDRTSSRLSEQSSQGDTKREEKRKSGACHTKAEQPLYSEKKEMQSKPEVLSPEKYHGKLVFDSSLQKSSYTEVITPSASKKLQEDKAKRNELNINCENYFPQHSPLSVVEERCKDVSSDSTKGVIDVNDKTTPVSSTAKKGNIKGKLKWLKNRLSKELPVSNTTSMSVKCPVEVETPPPRYQALSPSKYYEPISSEQLQKWVRALTRAIKDAKATKQNILVRKPSEESGVFETPHKFEDGDTETHATDYETDVPDPDARHRSQFMTVRSVEYDVMSATYDEADIESVSSLEVLYNWLTCRDEPEIPPRHLKKNGPVASSEDW